MTQLVKNPHVMWETWIRSLGWEDLLEKGTSTHSSILAYTVHGTAKSCTGLSDFHFPYIIQFHVYTFCLNLY